MESDNSNGAIRVALHGLAVNRGVDFAVPAGEPSRKFLQRVCVAAHRELGKGRYRASVIGTTVQVTHIDPADLAPAAAIPAAPPVPANDDDRDDAVPAGPSDDLLLTRKQAADYLKPWFPQGITAEQIRAFCNAGQGPAGVRNGRYVLHRVGALRAWAAGRLRPVIQEGRAA